MPKRKASKQPALRHFDRFGFKDALYRSIPEIFEKEKSPGFGNVVILGRDDLPEKFYKDDPRDYPKIILKIENNES